MSWRFHVSLLTRDPFAGYDTVGRPRFVFNPYLAAGPIELCADRYGVRLSWWRCGRGWTLSWLRGCGLRFDRLPL